MVNGRVVSSAVVLRGASTTPLDTTHAFVGFSCIFLLGIFIFKRLTARRLYKSFGIKGLN
jgi:hypothetical protein